ncbi:general transcription factor IIH subunit 3-like isoform X9 [Tripterygium wilfordii]|uniref:general transcription factor IIH subunit 3-like isoform X9 n=1 Tax=Tripterygium wilfordii TaxID=458696 RepID=UPI0018F84A2F|nr:general transcription factor IIH subunit 3-like isoform X9 [Tripterygium wilfordii]
MQVLAFLNSILLLNQLNQVVVIATGYSSCGYIYDSSSATNMSNENGRMPALYSSLLWSLEEFLNKDEKLSKREPEGKIASSLLSGSLSLALCYVQRVFRSGPLNPQARVSIELIFECNSLSTYYLRIMSADILLVPYPAHRGRLVHESCLPYIPCWIDRVCYGLAVCIDFSFFTSLLKYINKTPCSVSVSVFLSLLLFLSIFVLSLFFPLPSFSHVF